MTFEEVLAQVLDPLQRQGRVSSRALGRSLARLMRRPSSSKRLSPTPNMGAPCGTAS
jgi:hypothetical protein